MKTQTLRQHVNNLLQTRLELIEEIDQYLDNHAIGPNVNKQFGDVSSNNIRSWLDSVKFSKKFQFKESLTMTLEEYETHRHYNLVNMRAVGVSYEALFAAFVITTAGRKEYAAAYTLAASLYENVFLAGFKPERLPVLEVVTNLTMGITRKQISAVELITYFVDIVYDLGFDLNDNQYKLSASELAKLYLSCCALNKVRSAIRKEQELSNLSPVIQELATPIMEYLPLIELVRNISRGSPDWDVSTPVETINMMITSIESHELFQKSTLRLFLNQIYESYIKLCKLTRMSLSVKAQTPDEELW